jgi:hypothetical protein
MRLSNRATRLAGLAGRHTGSYVPQCSRSAPVLVVATTVA